MDNSAIERLENLLRNKGITKSDLAKEIGMNESTVYSWFLKTGGRKEIRSNSLAKVASCLGVSASFILNGDAPVFTEDLFYPVIKEQDILFEHTDRLSPLSKLSQEHNLADDNVIKVCFYDEAMNPLFLQDDVLLVYKKCKGLNEMCTGYYLLLISDEVCIRHVLRDRVSGEFYISCPNSDYGNNRLSKEQFNKLVTVAYKIVAIERVL